MIKSKHSRWYSDKDFVQCWHWLAFRQGQCWLHWAQRQTHNLLIPGERPELSDQLYRFAAVSGSVEIPGYVGRRGQLYNCVGKSCDYETQKLNRRGSTTFNASLTLPDLYLGHCVWYVGMITWYLGHCIWYLWMIIWYFIKIRLGAVI